MTEQVSRKISNPVTIYLEVDIPSDMVTTLGVREVIAELKSFIQDRGIKFLTKCKTCDGRGWYNNVINGLPKDREVCVDCGGRGTYKLRSCWNYPIGDNEAIPSEPIIVGAL